MKYIHHNFEDKESLSIAIKNSIEKLDLFEKTIFYCKVSYIEKIISISLILSASLKVSVDDIIDDVMSEIKYKKEKIDMQDSGWTYQKIVETKREFYKKNKKDRNDYLIAFKYSEIGTKPQNLKKAPSYGWYYLDGKFCNEDFEDNHGKIHYVSVIAPKNSKSFKLKIAKANIYEIYKIHIMNNQQFFKN